MESLPKDILIHIISYLQGEDVVRFKQFSSKFQKLLTVNRKYLRHPKLCIEIYTFYDDPNQNVYITINSCWLYKIVDLKPVYTPMKQWAKNRRRTDFFGPFFARKLPEHGLRSFFDFMLEKGDITLYMHWFRNAGCMSVLTEAIKSTPSQIRYVSLNPFRSGTEAECLSLLKAVGSHKRKTKRFPVMKFTVEQPYMIREYWTKLRTLNTVASRFSVALFDIPTYHLKSALMSIAEEWKESPFPIFHFRIFSDENFSEPWKLGTIDMQNDFKVSVDEESKIVRFDDLDYGDFIQFQKREAVYDHYGYETLDSMDVVITAHIE